MTGEEYTMQMDILTGQAAIIAEIDLEGVLDVISKSEALGPLLEPSRWIQGGGRNLERSRELVEAALVLQRAVLKLRNEFLPTR